MTRHIRDTSTSPFFDHDFAARVSPRKPNSPYKPRRTHAKLAAVEALAERWLHAYTWEGGEAVLVRALGRELLDTLNNAGEPST
jgi:hypothetical protein